MKFNPKYRKIILVLSLIVILMVGCSQPEATPTGVLQINPDPSRAQIELTANQPPAGYYLIETGALVQVLAEGFPADTTLRLFLSAPGTEYRDPVATSPIQDDGDGQLVFNFPANWDDGTPIDAGPMILIAEWEADTETGEDSMTIDVQYVVNQDS